VKIMAPGGDEELLGGIQRHNELTTWGRQASTGLDRSQAASRGAVGLVKSGKKATANTEFAYAA
jgi:hypothetical protein